MWIIKTTGRRGPNDVMWNVGGMVRVLSVDAAVELAFEAHAEAIATAPVRTIWTVFA